MQPIFRFAPSPNGLLHLGHAYAALAGLALARRAGGRFLLRIEDIDRERCRPEFEVAIERDLAWLGIEWQRPVRRQSDHMAEYAEALDRLDEMGLVYPGFMSRAEVQRHVAAHGGPRDPDGAPLYPGLDRDLSADERQARIAAGNAYALRLDMARAARMAGPLSWVEEGAGPQGEKGSVSALPELWGDIVLSRRDVPTSYHLSVVVDDAAQGVTHVARGRDLFHATSVQRMLQQLLGLLEPAYHHHRLILGADGRKLSKSDRSTSLASLREAGATPADIRDMVGLEPELRSFV